jgi:hypothetical protein
VLARRRRHPLEDPGDGRRQTEFAFVFAGHHLTIRCDGDSNDHFAFVFTSAPFACENTVDISLVVCMFR